MHIQVKASFNLVDKMLVIALGFVITLGLA
jgi:hypothetical protein